MVYFVTKNGTQLSELWMVPAYQFIADIDRGVRPRTLCLILNYFTHALFAFDEQDNPLFDVAFQFEKIVGKTRHVVFQRLCQKNSKLTRNRPTECLPGVKRKTHLFNCR